MSSTTPRPGQTTLAGWLIIGGSIVLVLTAWHRISTLHTLEVQEELRRVLSEPGLDGLGMSVSTLSEIVRVLCMVAAGAATASAILGFHALRRSTSARLALTLLAPLIAVGGFATAGFFAPMVVAGVVMLWLRPTRDWFAGRPWAPQRLDRGGDPTPARRPDPFAPQAPEPSADAGSPAAPPPYPGVYGAPAPQQPLPGPPTHPQHPPGAGVPPVRPGRLVAACVITWVATLAVAGAMGLLAVLVVADPGLMDQAIADAEDQGMDLQGLSHDELSAATALVAAVFAGWSLAAAALAVLVYRRVEWARIVLIISAATSGVLMLVMALMAPFLVVLVAAAAVTCALLLRPEVAAWFRG